MDTSRNSAAWINAEYGRLEVGPAPYPTPGLGRPWTHRADRAD